MNAETIVYIRDAYECNGVIRKLTIYLDEGALIGRVLIYIPVIDKSLTFGPFYMYADNIRGPVNEFCGELFYRLLDITKTTEIENIRNKKIRVLYNSKKIFAIANEKCSTKDDIKNWFGCFCLPLPPSIEKFLK